MIWLVALAMHIHISHVTTHVQQFILYSEGYCKYNEYEPSALTFLQIGELLTESSELSVARRFKLFSVESSITMESSAIGHPIHEVLLLNLGILITDHLVEEDHQIDPCS